MVLLLLMLFTIETTGDVIYIYFIPYADTWLESDDLKGTFCRRHQKFRIRAEDIHIVIWERSSGRKVQEESPQLSSPVHDSEIKLDTSIPADEIGPSDSSTEFLFLAPAAKVSEAASTQDLPQVASTPEHSVSDSTKHPSNLPSVVDTNLPVPPLVVPACVTDNKSNLLSGMEDYAADDVITLTLVEIPFDSVGNPVEPNPSNQDVPQVDAIPGIVLQPVTVEMQNASAELPLPTDPGQSINLPSRPPKTDSSPNPVCTIQQIPVQPCHQNKTTNLPPPALATSTPCSKTLGTKKNIVDNLMTSLVRKDNNFFVNSNLSSVKKKTTSKSWQPATLLKDSDVNGATKKAENFEGFQAKTVNNMTNSGSSFLLSKLLNCSSSCNIPEKSAASAQSFLAPAALGHIKPGRNGLSYRKMLVKDDSLNKEEKVRKLRLKLLKQLKAKKNKLLMLEKMAKLQQQNGSGAGDHNGAVPGGVNRHDHLRGFLQELQDHADNESIGTSSSCTSICSSPGDAEFFAELFSPSPADNAENDSRFLEMLADGYGISAEHSQQATGFDNPMKTSTSQCTSGADSLPNTFNQSASAEESLNLLSTSTMEMLNEDAAYLDSFVDLF